FLGREMSAQPVAALDALTERGLAEEEIGVPSDLRQMRAGCGVAGVGERRRSVADTQRERLQLIVRHLDRRDRDPARLERLALLVLARVEPVFEHSRHAEFLAELIELGEAARREPELGLRRFPTRAEHGPERPRDEIAPVV